MTAEKNDILFKLYGHVIRFVFYIMNTVPVVKKEDEQRYGDYRTKRVILECYDAMAGAMKTDWSYQTILDPPLADPSVAHTLDMAWSERALKEISAWDQGDIDEKTTNFIIFSKG